MHMRIHRSMSAGNKRTLLLSLVVTAVLLLLPISSHAAVFWDDELESGNTGYGGLLNIGPCGGLPSFEYDTVTKMSGAASLQLNYPGTPEYHQLCGGFADRTFPNTDDLWGRFYVRLSPGFVVDSTQTKMMRNDANDPALSFWWGMLFGSNAISVQAQNYPVIGSTRNFYTNVGDGALPTTGQWVCIETRIRFNVVGQSNGLIEAWKNGVQFMSYTGLAFRNAGQYSEDLQFHSNRMYRQDGGGSINYDRLAFGNTRIGCLGSVPTNDTAPPAAPRGLFIR